MDDPKVGSEGKSESQPDDVAKQGIEALLAGAMHEKMAKPKSSFD